MDQGLSWTKSVIYLPIKTLVDDTKVYPCQKLAK